MDFSTGEHIDRLITLAQANLSNVRIVRRDERPARSLIDLEGQWGLYRIIISEIILPSGDVRYAYYVLDASNCLVHGFDNSPDVRAIKRLYAKDYRQHLGERVPHEHDAGDVLSLTEPMTLEHFIAWLRENLSQG